MAGSKINITVLVNDLIVSQWIFLSVERLILAGKSSVSVIVCPDKQAAVDRIKNRPRLYERVYEAADRRLFRRKYDYYRNRDLSLLSGKPAIYDLRRDQTGTENNNQQLSDLFRRVGPDLAILFGPHTLNDEILNLPRYGFWRFTIDNSYLPGLPDSGYREVILQQPLTEAALMPVRETDSDSFPLHRSMESTYRFSVNENRNRIYNRATWFLPGIIEGLAGYGENHLNRLKKRYEGVSSVQSDPSAGGVKLNELLLYLGRLLFDTLHKVIYTDAFSWNLQIRTETSEGYVLDDFGSFKTIRRPKGRFWADPFVIAADQKYYLFVEEFIYRKNKAHISVIELDGNGQYLRSRKVLERPYHLSYPFTFRLNGEYYMIPETGQNRTIELYKSTSFPYQWEFVMNLMEDIHATDTTLLFHDNRCWMFVTVDKTGGISGGSTELYLYYSDDLFAGKWQGHPMNPVISDESNARCAGRLFFKDGILYRPSQDCSVRYGRALNLNRVTKLNREEYEEIRERVISPDWDKKLKGTHTINSEGGLTVIDVYRYHSRFSLK